MMVQENQHTRRLREAIDGFWGAAEDPYRKEHEKYLKLRVRPLMEFLIEKEDLDKMADVAKNGWFTQIQLEGFLKMAGEKHCLSAFVWLLQCKKELYGFTDKDFSL